MTAAEARSINEALGRLTAAIGEMSGKVSSLEKQTTKLEQQVSNEAQLCPYREVIASVRGNTEKGVINGARIDHVEDKMHALEVQFTKAGVLSGAAGGGIFSAFGLVVFAVCKAMGWL